MMVGAMGNGGKCLYNFEYLDYDVRQKSSQPGDVQNQPRAKCDLKVFRYGNLPGIYAISLPPYIISQHDLSTF